MYCNVKNADNCVINFILFKDVYNYEEAKSEFTILGARLDYLYVTHCTLSQMLTYREKNVYHVFNPLTPTSDQHKISLIRYQYIVKQTGDEHSKINQLRVTALV